MRDTTRKILKAVLWALLLAACSARAQSQLTPIAYSSLNGDGTANTNYLTMQPWPYRTWVIVGTNLINGNYTITLTPNSSGFVTNAVMPGLYKVTQTNNQSGFYVNVPSTTNSFNLSVGAVLTISQWPTNTLGAVRSLPTDTNLSFLGQDISGAGSVVVTTNTTLGVSTYTWTVPTTWPFTSITGFLEPSQYTYGFYTNGVATNMPPQPVYTNASGGYAYGEFKVEGSVTNAAAAGQMLVYASWTNELGYQTNALLPVVGLGTNGSFSASCNVALSNNTSVWFATTNSTNAVLVLRAAFLPLMNR